MFNKPKNKCSAHCLYLQGELFCCFQDYLREQPDNVKSFNIIGEVTRFLNVVYSNINGKNIELVIQLFETMNEFTAVRFFFFFFKIISKHNNTSFQRISVNFWIKCLDCRSCLIFECILILKPSLKKYIVKIVIWCLIKLSQILENSWKKDYCTSQLLLLNRTVKNCFYFGLAKYFAV